MKPLDQTFDDIEDLEDLWTEEEEEEEGGVPLEGWGEDDLHLLRDLPPDPEDLLDLFDPIDD